MFKRIATFALVLFISSVVSVTHAADDRALRRQFEEMQNETRVALVIGNADYASSPLKNPVNDTRLMARTLKGLGFDVIELTNATQKQMKMAVDQFGQKIRNGGVALFYYAGHGMQVGGRNYLIPVGANITAENEVEYESVDSGRILAKMENAGTRVNIVMLDACRNNPFARSFRSGSTGLASVDAPRGSFIAYATAPGSVAADGEGSNGLFTEQLVRAISTEGQSIENVFKQVRSGVMGQTGNKQVPWTASSMTGEFYFKIPTDPTQLAMGRRLPMQDQQPTQAPAPMAKGIGAVSILLMDGSTDEVPFTGFNAECDGYGDTGFKYSEQSISITIPWVDVKYVLPEYGIAILRNGHEVSTDGLRASSCPEAAVSATRSRMVEIAGYQKIVQEHSISIGNIAVVAFGTESLEEGRGQLKVRKIAEAEDALRSQRHGDAISAYEFVLDLDHENSTAADGLVIVKQQQAELQLLGYNDNGNGTVSAFKTGLVWQQSDDGRERPWNDAMVYCRSLSIGGHKDWRLPSKDELSSLVDTSLGNSSPFNSKPTINQRFFPHTQTSNYWSSTVHVNDTSYAWSVRFNDGRVSGDDKHFGYYVRCVRDGQ